MPTVPDDRRARPAPPAAPADPAAWEARLGRVSTCRDCGATICWELSKRGRWVARSAGSPQPHFLECTARPPYRRPPPAVPDDTCARCGSANVAVAPGAAMHFAGLRCLEPGCAAHRWLRRPDPALGPGGPR